MKARILKVSLSLVALVLLALSVNFLVLPKLYPHTEAQYCVAQYQCNNESFIEHDEWITKNCAMITKLTTLMAPHFYKEMYFHQRTCKYRMLTY